MSDETNRESVGEEHHSLSPIVENAHADQPASSEAHQLNRSQKEAVLNEMRSRSRRSFMVGGLAALTALGGWRWLRTRGEIGGLAWPLLVSDEFNEQLSLDYFSPARLAPTFPAELAIEPRINGSEGLGRNFDPSTWRLELIGLANPPEPASTEKTSSTERGPVANTTKKKASASEDNSNADDSSDGDQEDAQADGNNEGGVTDTQHETQVAPDLVMTLEEIKQLPRWRWLPSSSALKAGALSFGGQAPALRT